NYGLIINEIGMEGMIDLLQEQYLQPVAAHVFPQEGSTLDVHHAFVVQYKQGEDLGLDMHTDNSEVTFNICLGKSFDGSGLTFCGQMGCPDHRHLKHMYQHRLGRCVMHLGRQRHGADDLTSGERMNLIIWNRNINFRMTNVYQVRPLKLGSDI
ncbi:hypothetical protein CYMTET_30917, partial [Cymbomonas tetramitiformis]